MKIKIPKRIIGGIAILSAIFFLGLKVNADDTPSFIGDMEATVNTNTQSTSKGLISYERAERRLLFQRKI